MTHSRLEFEVFGKVQSTTVMYARTRILLLLCIHIGVYFRACTKEQADKLGLVGWVKNTPEGTVVGQAEGSSDKINAM
jgi:hypothetical protein